jgi:hypothetical protein
MAMPTPVVGRERGTVGERIGPREPPLWSGAR